VSLLLVIFITLLAPSAETTAPPSVVAAPPPVVRAPPPIVGAPPPVVAVPQLNSVSGYVSDDRRNPIPDLQVELLNDVDSVLQRTKTDSSGLFVFRRLSNGIFQVRVQTSGTNYIGQTQRVQLERTRAFEQVDFVLALKKSASMTAGAGSIFVQEVPDQARKEYERAASLMQKPDQHNEGVESLKKALDIFPNYFDALELLGTEYVKQQEFELAIPVLTKAIEVNRRAYLSMYALSVAQYHLQQGPEAIESMRRAITLNPKSVNGNLWLGTLLRQAAKLDEAETYLKQADHLAASKSAEAHWQLALLFDKLKRYKEAADELEEFLKIQPDSKDKELIKKLIQRFREKSGTTATLP
jgi:tetratricopeptide (TPR) repeat protein